MRRRTTCAGSTTPCAGSIRNRAGTSPRCWCRSSEDLLGDTRVQLLVLMGAAAAVLLIACANLASLLLSRAAGRRGELAVRAALGATRGRLVRQMVIEVDDVLVAWRRARARPGAGGCLGAGAAHATRIPGANDDRLDIRLLAFTARRVDFDGMVFGLVPALQAARASLRDALQQDARATVGGRGFTRDALVVLQVAAALVLLAGAGLMLRTMANLRAIELGFRPDHLLTLRTTLPQSKYRERCNGCRSTIV